MTEVRVAQRGDDVYVVTDSDPYGGHFNTEPAVRASLEGAQAAIADHYPSAPADWQQISARWWLLRGTTVSIRKVELGP